jgi:hypothetical protein
MSELSVRFALLVVGHLLILSAVLWPQTVKPLRVDTAPLIPTKSIVFDGASLTPTKIITSDGRELTPESPDWPYKAEVK